MATVPALMAFKKKGGFYNHKLDTAVMSLSKSATKIRNAFSFGQTWQGKVFTSAVLHFQFGKYKSFTK